MYVTGVQDYAWKKKKKKDRILYLEHVTIWEQAPVINWDYSQVNMLRKDRGAFLGGWRRQWESKVCHLCVLPGYGSAWCWPRAWPPACLLPAHGPRSARRWQPNEGGGNLCLSLGQVLPPLTWQLPLSRTRTPRGGGWACDAPYDPPGQRMAWEPLLPSLTGSYAACSGPVGGWIWTLCSPHNTQHGYPLPCACWRSVPALCAQLLFWHHFVYFAHSTVEAVRRDGENYKSGPSLLVSFGCVKH